MRRLGFSLAAACLATAMSVAGTGAARAAAAVPVTSGTHSSGRVTVRVDVSGPAIGQVGQHFIGLSVESGALRTRAPQLKNTGNLARLLANLGAGVLRFGGDTADDESFAGTSAATLRGLASLVRAAGWSVLYTENLGHFKAARVRADAKAVRRALGGNLFAFACGNEPDQYVPIGLRPPSWTVGDYLAQVNACYQAIRSIAPQAPLAGPDADYHRTLLASYARRDASTIDWYGAHYYPLGCRGLRAGTTASAATSMLSATTAEAEAARFDIYAGMAAIAGHPLVLTETSSACRGGIPDVSDSFASALWVIDYLLTGAEHGVHAMNIATGLSAACATYTVLCLHGDNEYFAQPVYYGLLLTRMLGTGRLVPVSIVQAWHQHITAFALRSGGRLRLLVENLDSAAAAVTLHVGSYRGTATADRLRAPSLLARSGVTIQERRVSADGSFSPGRPDTVTCAAAGCRLTLPGYSAALVKVPVG
ncbi:hypothetical protein [Trebonia kvetii]|nr:hypothetical protein [Trebonia kvetii]